MATARGDVAGLDFVSARAAVAACNVTAVRLAVAVSTMNDVVMFESW